MIDKVNSPGGKHEMPGNVTPVSTMDTKKHHIAVASFARV